MKLAEPVMRTDLRLSRAALGTQHSDTLVSISNLANVLLAQQNFDEAEGLMRENLVLCRKVHGNRHAHTLVAIHNLVYLVSSRGLNNGPPKGPPK